MTWFEQCFKQYNHKWERIKYANEQKSNGHSRNEAKSSHGIARCNIETEPAGFFNICASYKLTKLFVFGGWLQQTRLCKGLLQCSLHEKQKREADGCPSQGKEEGRPLFGMREKDFRKGWVGDVPCTLQERSCGTLKTDRNQLIWQCVSTLRRFISSCRNGLPPHRGKRIPSERNVREWFFGVNSTGNIPVHSFVCELPQGGAL